jgi:hypothetical protein
MPNPLNNVTVPDDYSDACTITGIYGGRGGSYLIANASVFVQLQYGKLGEDYWTDEYAVAPNAGAIEAGTIGIRFRNFVAGTVAVVGASITPPTQPGLQLGSAFDGTLTPSGTITPSPGVPGVSELDFAQITVSPAAVTATTEGTSVAQITGTSVSYSGMRVMLEFWAPGLSNTGAGALSHFVFYRDAVVLGSFTQAGPNTSNQDVFGVLFDTPAAGAHVYKVAMYVASGAATLQAGAGGAGAILPAFLRVTTAQ